MRRSLLFIVVASLLFIIISSNTSLSIFVLFCIYALSGYLYAFWCWWKGAPTRSKPTSPRSRPPSRPAKTPAEHH